MADQYELAQAHLKAAMAAMTACQDSLAMAVIAHALTVVERNIDPATNSPRTIGPAANRRPC
jgi:hypothetical protein